MTAAEYAPTQKTRVKTIKVKLAYYAILIGLAAINFVFYASNLMLWNMFHYTLKMPLPAHMPIRLY